MQYFTNHLILKVLFRSAVIISFQLFLCFLGYKLELDNIPSYTRITVEAAVANNRQCWLIFTASRAARLFVLQVVIKK